MNQSTNTERQVISPDLLKIMEKLRKTAEQYLFVKNAVPLEQAIKFSEDAVLAVIMLKAVSTKIGDGNFVPDSRSLTESLKLLSRTFHLTLFEDLINYDKRDSLLQSIENNKSYSKLDELIPFAMPECFGIIYEHMRFKSASNSNHRKTSGVYYTPSFMVDYVIKNSITQFIKDKFSSRIPDDFRLLDPSCGAGIFLIHAFNAIVNRGDKNARFNERAEILQNNIYGTDIDNYAAEITKFSLLYTLIKDETGNLPTLPDLSKNIFCSNSLTEEETLFHPDADKYDIIVGNPPYNAELSTAEKKVLKKKYSTTNTDTAALFLAFAEENLKPGGVTGFIVPKPFVYSSNWKQMREDLLPGITEIVDCGKAWKDVKFEQVILLFKKGKTFDDYKSGRSLNEIIHATGVIDKKYYYQFGLLLNGISDAELSLGLKIKNSGLFLNDIVSNHRGAPIQNQLLQDESDFKVIGGKQLAAYQINKNDVKGFLSLQMLNDSRAMLKDDSILVQNIVAHVLKPEPAIKITAALACSVNWKDYLILDTVNQLRNRSIYSSEFICAVLNSRLISWYVYNFIFGRAIRTMHFDNYVTKRIPIPLIDLNDKTSRKVHDKITELVKKLIEHDSYSDRKISKIKEEIEHLVQPFYKLNKDELKILFQREI